MTQNERMELNSQPFAKDVWEHYEFQFAVTEIILIFSLNFKQIVIFMPLKIQHENLKSNIHVTILETCF